MRRVPPPAATAIIKRFEGYEAVAYLCPGGAWTCGWGHTGPEVREDVTCTRRQAEIWLEQDLRAAARKLEERLGPALGELTDNQFAALLSFVFNLGADPGWTLWRTLKARDFDAVPAQLVRFVYAGGRKLAGLVARRNAEVELWSRDEPGSIPDAPSSGETRHADTPPAPAETVKAGPMATAVLTACTTTTVAVQTVTEAMQPFAAQSPAVNRALVALATIAAVAAAVMAAMLWLQRRGRRR